MILVVAEPRGGALNRASWEAVGVRAAGGRRASRSRLRCPAAATAARLLAEAGVGDVLSLEHEALAAYSPDVQVAAVAQAIAQTSPRLVVMAHTYQARDYAPRLAARLRVPLVADVIGVKGSGTAATFLRPMFQGKLVAEVAPQGAGPAIVSCQIGAFRADAVAKGSPGAVRAVTVDDRRPVGDRPWRRHSRRRVRRSIWAGRAHRRRGPRDQGAGSDCGRRKAGAAMGAEMAASRPICDNGWLPMDRQVGSSGQTVAPSSTSRSASRARSSTSSGMKGSRTIVAINKDADAPIFEVADYGIVGDLFEIVPALTAELEKPR